MIRLLSVAAMLTCLAFGAVVGQEAQIDPSKVRIASEPITARCIQSTIFQSLRRADGASPPPKHLSDAEILRLMAEGGLDVGSVLAPAGGHRPAGDAVTVHVGGRPAVSVVAPAELKVPKITVAQIRDLLTGKISIWEQLGARPGRLHLRADTTSLDLLCRLTGVPMPKPGSRASLSVAGWGETVISIVRNEAADVRQHAQQRATTEEVRRTKSKMVLEEPAPGPDRSLALTVVRAPRPSVLPVAGSGNESGGEPWDGGGNCFAGTCRLGRAGAGVARKGLGGNP